MLAYHTLRLDANKQTPTFMSRIRTSASDIGMNYALSRAVSKQPHFLLELGP